MKNIILFIIFSLIVLLCLNSCTFAGMEPGLLSRWTLLDSSLNDSAPGSTESGFLELNADDTFEIEVTVDSGGHPVTFFSKGKISNSDSVEKFICFISEESSGIDMTGSYDYSLTIDKLSLKSFNYEFKFKK